jgi:hypothetical protein
MKRLALLTLFALSSACGDTPTQAPDPANPAPELTAIAGGIHEAAAVLNRGEGKPNGWCIVNGITTTDATIVRNPTGGALLSCHWGDFGGPPYPADEAQIFRGIRCYLDFLGHSETNRMHFVLTPSGKAHMHCHFDKLEDGA